MTLWDENPPMQVYRYRPEPMITLDMRTQSPSPIRLGRGKRPKKGQPPAPTKKRAKVKAARKANCRRRK